MAITKTTYCGMLHIEYNEDGSILSRVQTNKTIVRDEDGSLLAPPRIEAVAIDEKGLAGAIGAQAAAVTAQVALLQRQIVSLTSDKAVLQTQIDGLQQATAA